MFITHVAQKISRGRVDYATIRPSAKRFYPPSLSAGADNHFGDILMSFNRTTRPYSGPKGKRVLIGETREEEAARLEKEIAAHPVTRCEPSAHSPSASRPGWSSKPFIPEAERTVAEGIAKKIMRKS
jgi:hypothetical protein